MEITYFFRNDKCGFSISKVFNTITSEISKTKKIDQYYMPAHGADLISILKNLFYVFKHRNKKGINHITGDIHYCILALIGCKSVLTIHDLSPVDCRKNPLKKYIFKLFWFRLPLLIADKVVCISEHTRNQLGKITNRKDIEVIYNAVDPSFEANLKPFNSLKPVILQVGTGWNKNLENLINAINSTPCHLVIVGSVDVSMINLLNKNKISYSLKTGLTDAELLLEYYKCDIVSFCSIYEGFGMPIIEGNAIGRCVITSAISPMTEIAANAACLVKPDDIISIENGLKQIIFDADYRNQLINNGFSNILRFKVADISKSYINLYSK